MFYSQFLNLMESLFCFGVFMKEYILGQDVESCCRLDKLTHLKLKVDFIRRKRREEKEERRGKDS